MAKKEGDLLATCEPYVHVLLHSQRSTRCEACLERSDRLKKCAGCGLVRYCDVKCQRSDWGIHRTECPCYRRVAPNIPLDSVRLFLRLLIRGNHGMLVSHEQLLIFSSYICCKRSDDTAKWPGDPGWCTFDQLMSHKTELQADPVRCEQFSQLIYTIKKLVADDFTLPPAENMLELFGKMTINTFTISDGECQAIGSGIYLSASKLDHSCLPNTVAVFRGKTLSLRAVADIDEVVPDKLFLSYIDQLSPTEDRREALRTQYYFTCGCDKCSWRKLDEVMLATRCEYAGCRGLVYRDKGALPLSESASLTDGELVACTGCHRMPRKCTCAYVKRLLQESKEKLQKIEEVKKRGEFPEALLLCDKFLKERGRDLHDNNVYLVKCRDKAFEVCIEMEKWEQALKYGEDTVRGFRLFYPHNSPVVGVHLMKVGKLELFLEKLQCALTHLKQARSILVVTHGRDHALIEDLLQLIDQCQEEMRIKMEKNHKHLL